jgi:hypothetical protein
LSISEKSFYHGAVLYEITEDEHFTSINKVPNLRSSSAYLLNASIGLFIKYATTKDNFGSWRFTFTQDHQYEIRKLYDFYKNKTFIIFVCEHEGFCMIDFSIFASCLDLNHKDQEWIEIYRPNGGGFRIRGARGDFGKVIPLNNFPRKLFE